MAVQPTRDELTALIERGEIDTVIMAFGDLQGRLVGKRTTGRFFLEHVAEHGTENCDYLIATDMDDNAVPGYRFASYDLGYGDMVARADFSTLRITPWVPRTAVVLCDLLHPGTNDPIAVSPRQVLRDVVARAGATGLAPMVGSEIEFFLFRDSVEEAHAKGYENLEPHAPFLQDYQILQTTRDEYVIGDIRRGLEAAGIPVEYSKGEAGRGQHEINLAFTDALAMADRNLLYKHATKEIASLHGRSVTFMAKYDFAETGSSCHVHCSVRDVNRADQPHSLFALDAAGDPMGMFAHWLAGLVHLGREFAILWAPTVNSYKRYQLGSWAPTAVAWGGDNRTVGFRVVGHGDSTRVECRLPGADANSYFAFAGIIAAGMYGVRHSLPLPAKVLGNAYGRDELPRVPFTLGEAIDAWEASAAARECFGDDVHHHLLTAARHEWQSFHRSVTDWERRRYFDRA